MRITKLILNLLITFSIALILGCLVTFLWNYYIENTGAIVDWKVAFTLAITLSVILSLEKMKHK